MIDSRLPEYGKPHPGAFCVMRYTILLQTGPESRSLHLSALKFARALVEAGHTITRLFFYNDAVRCANANTVPPQDELSIEQQWHQFRKEHHIDAVVCIAAALQRGILDQKEAERYQKQSVTLSTGFELGGLGQLAEACHLSDRVVSF